MRLEYFQEVASGEVITGYYTDEHVAGLTEDLRSLVLESFFDNEDLIRFLQHKNSRDAALKNLKDQQSEITNYTQELDNAVKKASQNIEQAVSGLISLEFEKQVDVYKEKADPAGGWFYRFFKYNPQNNQNVIYKKA